MTGTSALPPEPVFLAGPAGRLFAVYHPPAPSIGTASGLVYVPPFAEEMNRSRRMVALQARALADAGISVLLLDLYGTGDSEGEFRDARWSIWLADVAAAADWLQARLPGNVGLWGLRLGGLIAAEAANAQPDRFSRLVLWHPVSDGRTMLTQFLRIRVAASMHEGRARETTEALRAVLASGRSVEVAGYEVASELAAALDEARLEACRLSGAVPIDWLELADEADAALAPARQGLVDGWRAAGLSVSSVAVAGDQFWTTQEITLAPRLIDATLRSVAP